jgi:peptidoglycan/LPS O-acetylase OafA/YrhL
MIVGGDRAAAGAVSQTLSVPALRWLGRMSYA